MPQVCLEHYSDSLDRIERGKFSRVVWWRVIRELVLGLLAEIATIHEEQDALGTAELEQAIGRTNGGERLFPAAFPPDEGSPNRRRHVRRPLWHRLRLPFPKAR